MVERKVNKEALFEDFDEAVEAGDTPDWEVLADKHDVSTSTINRWWRKYKEAAKDQEEAVETFTRDAPAQVLREQLEEVPGANKKGIAWVVRQVKADESLLRDANRLFRLIKEATGVKSSFVEQIVRSTIRAAGGEVEAEPAFFPGSVQGQGAGAFSGGMHGQARRGAPFGPAQQSPGASQGQESLSKEDVAEIVAETLEEREREKQREQQFMGAIEQLNEKIERVAEQSQESAQYEEVAMPVTDEDGNVKRDESGAPIRKIVRRPIGAGQDDGNDVLEVIQTLGQAGLIGGDETPESVRQIERQMDKIEAKLDQGAGDDEAAETFVKMQEQLAELKAELAAQEAKREVAQEYHQQTQELQGKLLEKELEVERQTGDMPADAKILDKSVDKTEETLARVLDNQDRRMDRLERVAMVILSEGGAENLPTGDVELEDLEALREAQEEIDRREGGVPTDAGGVVDPKREMEPEEVADEAEGEAESEGRWPGAGAGSVGDGALEQVVDEEFSPPGEEE